MRKRRKYSRAMHERAQKALQEVPKHQEAIRIWKKALGQLGGIDEGRVVAVEVTEDGNFKVELETPSSSAEAAKEENRTASEGSGQESGCRSLQGPIAPTERALAVTAD